MSAESANEQRTSLFLLIRARLSRSETRLRLLDEAGVAERGARAGDPAEAIGARERFAEEKCHAAAVVNLRVANVAVQKQEAVVVLVDRCFGIVMAADVTAAGDGAGIIG